MDEATWTPDQLWQRALKHAKQVEIDAPEEIEVKNDAAAIVERELYRRIWGEGGKKEAANFAKRQIRALRNWADRGGDDLTAEEVFQKLEMFRRRLSKLVSSLGRGGALTVLPIANAYHKTRNDLKSERLSPIAALHQLANILMHFTGEADPDAKVLENLEEKKFFKAVEIDAPEEIEVKGDTDTIAERKFLQKAKEFLGGSEPPTEDTIRFFAAQISAVAKWYKQDLTADKALQLLDVMTKRTHRWYDAQENPGRMPEWQAANIVLGQIERAEERLQDYKKVGEPESDDVKGGGTGIHIDVGDSGKPGWWTPRRTLYRMLSELRNSAQVMGWGTPKRAAKVLENMTFTEAVRKADDIPYAKLLEPGKRKQTRARIVKDIPTAKLLRPAPGTETPSMRLDREAAQAADQGWEDWEKVADEPMSDEDRASWERARAAMQEHLTFVGALRRLV